MDTKTKTPVVSKRRQQALVATRKKINSPLSVLPTLLTSPDPQDVLFLQKFAQNKEASHRGKFAKVYIARETENKPLVAIKQQPILTPKNKGDTAFRELRIYQHLIKLGLPNFIQIVDYAKCHDAPSIFSPEGAQKQQKVTYMHYILEYAEKMLLDVKEVTVGQLREILLQLLYTICIAQEKCQFVHGDLHFKNVLVKKNTTPIDYKYTLPSGKELHFQVRGDIVKLCDFGLSRIRLDNGEVLYNEKAPLKDYFDATADIVQIAQNIGKLKVTDWEKYKLEDKLQLSMLKRQMVKGEAAAKLLQHEFFRPLLFNGLHGAKPAPASPLPKIIITDPRDVSHDGDETVEAPVRPTRVALVSRIAASTAKAPGLQARRPSAPPTKSTMSSSQKRRAPISENTAPLGGTSRAKKPKGAPLREPSKRIINKLSLPSDHHSRNSKRLRKM